MSLSKVVTGSLAGAALAWSAGANAGVQDYIDGQEDAMAYGAGQISLWCGGFEGTESYAPCVATHALYIYLDLQVSSWWLSFIPSHNYEDPCYVDGVLLVANQFLSMSSYSGGS